MRHTPSFVWEIVEAETDAWEELTQAAPIERKDEADVRRRRRFDSVIAVAVALCVVASVTGYQLWMEAERGVERIEEELGAVVQLETIRQHLSGADGIEDAGVESVVLNLEGALVSVVVTDTSPAGETTAYTETRFYRPDGPRWTRCAPIASFWGNEGMFDTATLHFTFRERDRALVDASADSLENYVRALRTFLGLPARVQSHRIAISIEPRLIAGGFSVQGDAILVASPLLYRLEPGLATDEVVRNLLRFALNRHAIKEALIWHRIQPEWTATVTYLEPWLNAHAAELPALVEGKPLFAASQRPPYADYLLSSLQASTMEDYSRGYAEYRSQIMASITHAFYDFLAFDQDMCSLSPLLAAFGAYDSWRTVSSAAFRVSEAELQAAWHAYLRAPAAPSAARRKAMPDAPGILRHCGPKFPKN